MKVQGTLCHVMKGLIVPVPKSHKTGACVPDNFRGIFPLHRCCVKSSAPLNERREWDARLRCVVSWFLRSRQCGRHRALRETNKMPDNVLLHNSGQISILFELSVFPKVKLVFSINI